MGNVIVTEIKALVLRHRLFESLQDRADIRAPKILDPALTKQIPQFLLAGLDYRAELGSGGWPAPTGARYSKLCFSPTVQAMADTSLKHLSVPPLPTDEEMFEDYVADITSIPVANAGDFYRLYRITPGELFQSCKDMREHSPYTWPLLLSNEFALAKQTWPNLGKVVPGSSFKHPLIYGFMLIAELERSNLIMRDLARASKAFDRPRLIEALSNSQPLKDQFEAWELGEVSRWLSYASLSKKALWDLLFDRKVDQLLALPDSHTPWALAQGKFPSDVENALDDAAIRRMLSAVFELPPLAGKGAKRRKSMLRDDVAPRWYGMTNQVIPILALDGALSAFPTRKAKPYARTKSSTETIDPIVALTSAIRERQDPISHAKIRKSSKRYVLTANVKLGQKPKEATFERNRKFGRKMALIYLPPKGRMGSAARFDPRFWAELDADRELWTMLSPVRRPWSFRRLGRREQVLVRKMIEMLLRAFEPLFRLSQHSDLAVRIACDLATAISPISANPQIAQAIAALDAKPKTKERLGFIARRNGYGKK